MLDAILKREDVQNLMKEIVSNSRYYNKRISDSIDYQLFVDVEQPLFLFFDALLKFQIIIDDLYYFDDYLQQIDKLMKKIDNFHDIRFGIHRILGHICSLQLGLNEVESPSSKKEVLMRIFERYIENGYFFRGISSIDREILQQDGFQIEESGKNYADFLELNRIFQKYGYLNFMQTDFTDFSISFTDSAFMACYYSVNSPIYFYHLLCGHEEMGNFDDAAAYFHEDYDACLANLKRFLANSLFCDADQKRVLEIVEHEWKRLQKGKSDICLMMVPRKVLVQQARYTIDSVIRESTSCSLGESVDKLLYSRYGDIKVFNDLQAEDIQIVSFPGYRSLMVGKKPVPISDKNSGDSGVVSFSPILSNAYGKVNHLLLIGAILITLGVVFTIIFVVKGM